MPDHGHALIWPRHPLTISQVLHDIKKISARKLHGRRGTEGPLGQHQFWDRFAGCRRHAVFPHVCDPRRGQFLGSPFIRVASLLESAGVLPAPIYRGPRRDYGGNHLHFVTTSTYRRARLFDSLRFRRNFVSTLDALRTPLQFKILGYVLMPEHFHLLLWPSEEFDPSHILKSLKERTAKFMLRNLLDGQGHSWCRKMLEGLTLPATVHDESHYRVWQRRFYDMNLWTEKKRLEKLKSMHGNPVRTGVRQWSLLVTCH